MIVANNYAIAVLSDWLKNFASVFQEEKDAKPITTQLYVWFFLRFEQVILLRIPMILMFILLQVRYLKIIEKSGYQALPWVRYITQNGGKFFFRFHSS